MGNDGLSIVGIVLVVIGFIVASIIGIHVQKEAESLGFIGAFSVYFAGFVIGVFLVVIGGIILIFSSRRERAHTKEVILISKPKPKIFKGISEGVAVIGAFIAMLLWFIVYLTDFLDSFIHIIILFFIILILISLASLLVSWLTGERPFATES